MRAWKQLRLVLFKNFLLRTRQPIILALEVLWPITIFLIVLSVRRIIPPIDQPICHYNARAQPSAGALPFLQSLICNIDNECLNQSRYEEIPSYGDAKVASLVDEMYPLMADQKITNLVRALPKGVKLMQVVANTLEEPEIKKVLEEGIPVKDLIKDEAKVREILVTEANISSKVVADALLNSHIKIPKLMQMMGSTRNLTDTACNPSLLKQYLVSQNDEALEEASIALCKLEGSSLLNLIDRLQQEVDGRKIMKMLSEFMSRFGRPDVGHILEDLGNVWDTLFSLKSLPFDTTGLNRISIWFPHLKAIYKSVKKGHVDLFLASKVASDLEPLYENKEFGNEIKEMIKYFNTLAGWVKKGLNLISEVHAVLGSLFRDTNYIEEKMRDTLNPRVLKSLFSVPVSTRMKQELRAKKTPREIYTLLCKDPGLAELVYQNNSESLERDNMLKFQVVLCGLALNGTAIEFIDLFNFKGITAEEASFSEFVNNTASVLNTIGILIKELSGSSQNYSAVLPKFLDAILSFFVPSSASDAVRVIDGVGVTLELIQELHGNEKINRAFSVIYQLLNHSLDIVNFEHDTSVENGVFPYWPYLVETFYYTFSDEIRWKKVLDLKNWPEIFCNPIEFSSTFILKDIDVQPMQAFSCQLFSRHLKVVKQLKDSASASGVKWGGLIDKSATLLNYKKEQEQLQHYKWKRLINAYRSFSKIFWRKMDVNKRVSFSFHILNWAGQYIQMAKVPYWQDMIAIFYSSDQTLCLINKQVKSMLDDNSIQASHLSLNLPTLKTIVSKIVPVIPDAVVAIANVITKDFKQVLDRIEKLPYSLHQLPCERGSLTDIIKFKDESRIRNLEQTACIYGPLISQEVLTESTVSKVLTAIQNVSRGKAINYNWTEAGQHTIDFIENSKTLSRFNGTIFPDIPEFSIKRMKTAITEVKDMFANLKDRRSLLKLSGQLLDALLIFTENILSTAKNKTPKLVDAFLSWKNPHKNQNNYLAILKYAVKAVSTLTEYLANIFGTVSESKEVLLSDIINNTVIDDIFGIMNDLPDILLIATEAIMNPQFSTKISKIVETNMSAFCSNESILEELYSVSEETDVRVDKDFQKKLCRIHHHFQGDVFSGLLLSGNVLGIIPELKRMWENSSYAEGPIQFRNLVDHVISIDESMQKLQRNKPILLTGLEDTLFSPSKWEDVGGMIIAKLQQAGSEKFTLALRHMTEFLNKADKESNHKLSNTLAIVSVYLSRIDNLLQNAKDASMDGSKNFTVADIFSSVPEFKEIVQWSETYLITGLEVLLYTANTDYQKLSALMSDEKILEKLCNNSAISYLTPLPNITDVAALEEGKEKFCAINWNEMIKKWQDEITNSTSEEKIDKFLSKLGSILDGITFLAVHGEITSISSPLFNSTSWEALSKRVFMKLNNTRLIDAKKQVTLAIEILVKKLRGNFTMLKSVDDGITTATCVLRSIRGGMSWEKLSTLYAGNERIESIFIVVNGSTDLVKALLNTIQEPYKLSTIAQNFIYPNDRKLRFCSVTENEWGQYFSSPQESFGIFTALQTLICGENIGMTNASRSKCFSKVTTGVDDIYINNTVLAEHLYELYEVIVDSMHTSIRLPSLASNISVIPWADIPAWKSLFEKFIKNVKVNKIDINSIPLWMTVVGKGLEQIPNSQYFLKSVGEVLSLYAKKTKLLNDKNPTAIALQDLFPESPNFQNLLRSWLPNLPEIIETLFWVSLNVRTLPFVTVTGRLNLEQLCSGSLQEYVYNPSLNDEQWAKLTDAICTQNYTAISTELQRELQVSKIKDSEPIDWKNFGEDLLTSIKLSQKLIDRKVTVRNESWNQETTWINSLKNMTMVARSSAVMIYLPLSQLISHIPVAYSTACYRDADNGGIKQLLCNLSLNSDVWFKANSKLARLLNDLFDEKTVSWKSFYTLFMDITQLQPIVEALTNGRLDLNMVESDIFAHFPVDFKTENFTWKQSLEIIPYILSHAGSTLKDEKFSQPIIRGLHSLVWITIKELTKNKNNGNNVTTVEDILPNMPHTQEMFRSLLPVLPEAVTTLLWTLQVPDKFMKWITDSKKYATSPLNLICKNPPSKYLYNPAFKDEDWDSLLSPLCGHNYTKVTEELEKAYNNYQNTTDYMSWKRLGTDIVHLINLLEEVVISPKLIDTYWISTIQNFTLVLHRPEIKAYLTLHWPFSRFCNSNYVLNTSILPSHKAGGNVSELQQFLCDISKEKFANDVVGSFRQLVALVRDFNRGKNVLWKSFYNTVLEMLQVKKLLHALLGDKLFATIGQVEKDLLSITDITPPVWKDPEMWKNIINIFDNIYSMTNKTESNFHAYFKYTNIITNHLESLLKRADIKDSRINVEPFLAETSRLQVFAELVSTTSMNAVEVLWKIMQEEEEKKLSETSAEEWERIFCNQPALFNRFKLPYAAIKDARRYLCFYNVPELWADVVKKFEYNDLKNQLGELTNFGDANRMNYTSFYSRVFVLVDTLQYLIKMESSSYNSKTLNTTELQQRLSAPLDAHVYSVENMAAALASLSQKLFEVENVMYRSKLGMDGLRVIYYAHWYIVHHLNNRLHPSEKNMTLGNMIMDDTKLNGMIKHFEPQNQLLITVLLNSSVKSDKLSQMLENDLSVLFCKENLEDWLILPTGDKVSSLKDVICSENGLKLLKELNSQLSKAHINHMRIIYHPDDSSSTKWNLLIHEVQKLVESTSYLAGPPFLLIKPSPYLVNITKIELALENYTIQYHASSTHRYVNLILMLVRAIDGLTGQHLIHAVGRNLSPVMIVSMGKFIDSVIKGSIYEAMTSTDVWDRLMKEMFPLLPDVAFIEVRLAGEYFSDHPEQVRDLCKLATKEYSWLKSASYESIMNIYCQQPPDQWEEKLDALSRLQPSAPMYIVDNLHLLLSTNYTVRNLYHEWASPKLYSILENAILMLADKFATSPPGFYMGEQVYWRPVFESLKSLIPSLFNSMNNQACSRHHISNKRSAIATLVNQLVTRLPRIEKVICEYPQFNLSMFYQEVSSHFEMKTVIKMAYQLKEGKLTDISCMSAFKPVGNAMAALQQLLIDVIPAEKFFHLKACAIDARNGTFFNSVQKYTVLIKHLSSLIQEFSNSTKEAFSSPQNIWKFIQDFFTPQMPAFARLSEVVDDVGRINKKFQQSPFNLSSETVSEILNSSINLNWVYRRNFSQTALEQQLCLKDTLIGLLVTASTEKLENNIKKILCQNGGLEVLLNEFDRTIISAKLPVLQKEYFLSGIWLQKLISKAQSILNHLFDLLDTGSKLTTGLTADLFQAFAKVINENTVEKLFSSIQGLIKALEPVLQGSSIIDDLKIILKGIQGLKSLQGLKLFDIKYNVQDLFSDSNALKKLLKKDLSIDNNAADAIMDANIDLTSLLASGSSLSAKDLFCNPKELNQLLNIENTDISIHEISTTLCNISGSQAVKASTLLVRELALSRIIGNFAKFGIDGILQKANLSSNEAVTAIDIIKTAPSIMPKIKGHITRLTEFLDPEFREHLLQLNISRDGIRIFGTPQALRASGKILCGKPLRMLQDEYKLLEVSRSEPQLDLREIEELPSGFCQQGYAQVMKMIGGPIVWGFFKPILRGKILFAPNNSQTRLIMQQLNATFDSIAKFINTLHAWGEGTSGLQYLQKHEGTLGKMKNLLQSDAIQPLLVQVIGEDAVNILEGFNISSLRNQVSNVSGLLDLVQLIGNMSQCFELNRFMGLDSEAELEQQASYLSTRREFIAAVVFLNMDDKRTKREIGSPSLLSPHIQYKLRMDIDNVPSTHKVRDKFWRPGPRDNFLDELRYFRGFLQLQELVDEAIITIQTSGHINIATASYMQQFPYPCYEKDEFGHFLKATLPVIMTVAWIFLIAFLVRERVLERELHLEEIMRVMGLKPWVGWIAWFISGLIILTTINVSIVLILKYGGILPHSNFLLLLVFLMLFAITILMFCYFISVFFNTATIAALTGIIIYLLSFLPFILIITLESEIPHWQKLLSCLMVSTSFCYGCVYITRYEDQGVGMHWEDIWSSPDPKDDMSFGLSLAMMLAGSALYFILGWYISNIWPANQARRQPWYFFLLSSYWRSQKVKKFPVDYPSTLDAHSFIENELKSPRMEDSKATGHVGISLNNLHVVYNKGKSKERIAVAGLTLDLFEDHITTLLGQNGAGKTTTINILTGQYPPTSGTAFVYGKAISKEFSEIQKLLGYCPQYNTLFDQMTVREHLKFYGRLKGILCGKKLEQDIDEMLHSMGLWHQQKEQARYLSGGMQRRLCVSLAFIGGSKLIILDEPTSSVDPVARRNIWDLIMKYRHGRTILLTTHHMDEADILSDRVAIIHRGKLLCSGSPLLLKSKFGCGYQLTLSRQGTENDLDSDSGRASSACSEAMTYDTDGLLNFVQNIIPTATLMEDHGTEVVLSLPQRSFDGSAHNFHDFFTRLDSNLNQLGFGTYGLSSTTLEEVFLTLCHLEDTKLQLSSPCSLPNPMSPLPNPIITRSLSIEKYSLRSNSHAMLNDLVISNDPWSTHNLNLGGSYQLEGANLKMQQLLALLMKRCYHTIHDWKAILSSILLPCVFIAIAMGFALIKPAATPEPMLLLTPSIYGPGDVSFVGTHNVSNVHTRLSLIENLLMTTGIGTACMKDRPKDVKVECNNLIEELLSDAAKKYLPSSSVQENYCSCSGNLCTKLKNDERYPYVVTASDDIVFNLTGVNVNDHILSTYMSFTERRYGGWTFADAKNLTEIKVWYENSGYHSAPSFLNSISNAILRTNMKSLGKDPSEYGITVYNHPLHLTSEQLGRDTIVHRAAEIGIALVFLLGFAFVPSSFIVYVVRERTQEEKRLQYVGGVGPLLYWSSALLWDMLLVVITVMLSAGIIVGFSLPVYVTRFNLPAVLLLLLLFGWATTPLMYLLEKLFQEASIAFMVLYCINIFIGLNIMVALLVLTLFSRDAVASELVTVLKYVAMAFPQYAMVGGLFELARNHIQADIFAMFGQDTYRFPFEMDVLGQYYMALAVEGVVFFLINLLLEFQVLKCKVMRKQMSRSPSIAEDSDVAEERKRVHSDLSKHDVLKLANLTQVFRSMAGQNCAVDNVSLSVPKGECFGLLGVNGAGKTTLFRILTGQLQPTSGNAFVKNMSVSSLLSSSSQLLGYCPQADALDDLLTPEQHLSVYARLRGIPSHEIKEVISHAISKFQLRMYADRKVGTLSRGTKRKVCTAISMLGNPQIILLDEPTTGMDPVTRRLVWTNVQQAIKDQRSVILTSHSMEECDVLCSRLAIMVNGKLRCLGTPQYLKYKFGTGYTISIRVADEINDWGSIVNFIHSNFPSAILRAHHCNMVEFSLPSKSIPLSTIFGSLEKHGSDLSILDISVSQTTLDQVFVSFARQQTDGILDSDVPLDAESIVDKTLTSVYDNCLHQDVIDKNSPNIELSAFSNSGFIEDEISTISSYSNSFTKASTVNMYEEDEDCSATKF